ncbi:hypothetical protein [Maricaulis sp.]|jgi:hypothetical protein|uniref:hypothetical protein n=1 Tax=Maricaulis sp. TaxID=1486257 RepID=UPI002619FF72|nr:hypothetical protein [Maricaulis sp.]
MAVFRTIAAFLAAVLTGTVLVSIANTHVVLQALVRIGASIPTAARLEAIQRDLTGFAPTLFVLIFAGFAIAFPVAGILARILGEGWRRLGFTLAGGGAVAAIMLGITAFYGQMLDATITPVASSRELTGLLTLCLGGAAAGFLFATLQPPPRRDR